MSTTMLYDVILNGGGPLRTYGWLRYDGGGRFTLYDSTGNEIVELGDAVALNVGVTIGDGAANYAAFAGDGSLTFAGTARVSKTLLISPSDMQVQAANPAAWVDLGIAGAWQFADGATNSVSLVVPVPVDMDLTVAPEFQVLWSSTTVDPGDGSRAALWQTEGLYRSRDEDVTAAAEETLSQVFPASTVSHGLVRSILPGVVLPASTDEILLLRVSRLGGDASDTLGDTAELSGVRMIYTSNKLGA